MPGASLAFRDQCYTPLQALTRKFRVKRGQNSANSIDFHDSIQSWINLEEGIYKIGSRSFLCAIHSTYKKNT